MNAPMPRNFLFRFAPSDTANIIALTWWCWALLPSDHVIFNQSHAFDAMHRVASEQVWGSIVLALLVALVIARYSGHDQVHVAVLIACASFWALVAMMLLVSNNTAPGVGAYAAFSTLTAWRAARLMGGG